MVKSIIYTLTAIALCVGFFTFTEIYINKEFDEFYSALDTLYDKVENEQANREDAYSVKQMWANKKEHLHIFIPHNDISYVDYWLNEACALIYTGNYDLALGKVEVLKEIAKNLPNSYSINLENVL
jgi:hypothetical protein